jgi:hypothetical protein
MPESSLLAHKDYSPSRIFSYPGVICAFSHRAHKNMSLFFGDTKESLENRRNFLGELGISPLGLVCAKQVHGTNIRYVVEEDRGKGALSYESSLADIDALITDKKNLALAIFTADCLPIFLLAPQQPAIALVHCGWRSSKYNLVAKTIKMMQENFNIRPQDLRVAFGPAIKECCYEVGEELRDFFAGDLMERNGRHYLDLSGINKKQILSLGVKETNIFDSKICTSCRNQEFFSFRLEGKGCGRMMSVAMLK